MPDKEHPRRKGMRKNLFALGLALFGMVIGFAGTAPGIAAVSLTVPGAASGAGAVVHDGGGVGPVLRLTPDAVAEIFLGKITKWNDPKIALPNPGAKLPGSDIVVAHRSDGSGTNDIFTN